jgi:hypothetical protein
VEKFVASTTGSLAARARKPIRTTGSQRRFRIVIGPGILKKAPGRTPTGLSPCGFRRSLLPGAILTCFTLSGFLRGDKSRFFDYRESTADDSGSTPKDPLNPMKGDKRLLPRPNDFRYNRYEFLGKSNLTI